MPDKKNPRNTKEPMVDVWKYSSKNKKNAEISVVKGEMKKKDIETIENPSNRFGLHQCFYIEIGGHHRILSVPYEEGKIEQGTLWLRERDDKRAIELFRQDALNRIESLKKLIENREAFISNVHVKE